jgi:two-component system cell cycle sensor histidine kinase/response regulator CckA
MRRAGEPTEQAEVHTPTVKGYTILLIEDNPDHRMLECRALQALGDGTRIVAVDTALEGLAALEDEEFELVIADYRMPGMDGLKLLHILNERHVDVPVVIVTGLGDERVAARALGEGAYDYVIKESGYLTLLPSIAERAIAAFRTQHQLNEARKELADSEERYRELVHGVDAIVWEAEPATWEFTFVSQRAEAILGYPVDMWLNNPGFYLNLVHPDDREEVVNYCRSATAERRDQVFEFRAIASDGRIVWLRNLVRVIGNDEKITRFQGLMVDITERLTMEQDLLNAQKLESVGLLAGGIAHDFNNVLTVIHGYSQLVLEELGDNNPSRADIEKIQQAAEQAASLTQQLLAFSRRQMLQPKILDLNAVIGGLEPMLRRIIGEDIDIHLRLRPDLSRTKADPGQIEQVVMNLAVNARDAMPSGGKLTIETATVNLDEACTRRHIGVSPGDYVMLAVSDTGCGMSSNVQAHIFEPFFTTKDPGKGTGLGLSTVYGIVKQSGGDIWVYSEPDRGTTFKIYLPSIEAAVDQKPSGRPKDSTLTGTETLLLVEDDQGLRELAYRILHRCGYTVLSAGNAEDAVRLCSLQGGSINLLVTDIVMPGANGPELSRRLTTLHPNIKTLYMSGYTSGGIPHDDAGNRGTAFLQKPFTEDMLTRSVREILDSSGN